jgi:serine/threonine protein kinase
VAFSGGTRVGPYEIIAALGAGGMGEVYRATDTNLKRQVALKVLPASVAGDAERVARFQREAVILAALNHPNIAHIHGLEKSDGTIALAMELVEGPTLADRIARGAVPLDEALPIARQIAEALEAAHEEGIIHRDLKPANVKVRADGTVKVLDFGLAKLVEHAGTAVRSNPALTQSPTITTPAMTQAGIILGTASYMAPEQATGKPVDKRSDLWAFGAVLMEMLIGRQVFNGETASHVIAAVLKDDPDWAALPSNTPAGIRKLLRRCLEKDPKRRIRDAGDLRLELDDALSVSTSDGSHPASPSSSRGMWFASVATVVVALVGLTVLGTVMATRRPPVNNTPLWFAVRPVEGNTIGSGRASPLIAVAPDGQKLVYVATRSDGVRQLWLHRFDAPLAQVIASTERATSPFWAPDNRWIGYSSGSGGKLMKVDLVAGTTQTLCDAANFAGGTWNRDGTIVFAAGSPRRLYRVAATGGLATMLGTSAAETDTIADHDRPQFLPDGRHVLFFRSGHAPALLIADIQANTPPLTIRKAEAPAIYGSGYLMFAEGNTLVALPFDPDRMVTSGEPIAVATGVDITEAAYSVSPTGVLAFRGPARTELTQLTWFDREGHQSGVVGARAEYQTLSIAPDGNRVATEITDERTGQTDLYVIDAHRAVTSRLTFTHAPNEMPIWSPDGSRVAFASHNSGPNGGKVSVMIAETSSGAIRTVSNDAGHVLDWSPDGRFVLYIVNESVAT